jgi:HK97 family phage portal protein
VSSRIAAAFGVRRSDSLEDPTVPISSSKILRVFGLDSTTADGVTVNEATALRMTAVYRAVALLSGLVGSLPLHAYDGNGAARRRVDEPVIDDPNADLTRMEVFEYVGTSLFTHGNSFNRKMRDGLGFVRELEPMHPSEVVVEQDDRWKHDGNPTGKMFTHTSGASTKRYLPSEVLHIPGLSYDGLVGLSPIQLAKQGITMAMLAQRFGTKMFSRGGLIPGVLETDAALNPDAADALQDRWSERTSGSSNWWRVPILDRGAKFKAIALPPKDALYLEAQQWGVVEVARMYGLPPHLLGDVERSTSWGSGIEQQNMQMLTFTLDPWLVRIEQRISKELLGPGRYVKFNRGALLRADTASRYLAHQRSWQNGWMNADEIRELEDLPPLPDGLGQVYHRPKNIEPVTAGATDGDDDA